MKTANICNKLYRLSNIHKMTNCIAIVFKGSERWISSMLFGLLFSSSWTVVCLFCCAVSRSWFNRVFSLIQFLCTHTKKNTHVSCNYCFKQWNNLGRGEGLFTGCALSTSYFILVHVILFLWFKWCQKRKVIFSL